RGFDPERMLLLDPGAPGGLGAPGAPAPGLEGPSEAVHAGGWLGPPPDPAAAGDPAPEEAAGGVLQEDDLGRVARSRAGRAAVTRYDSHLVEVEVEASAPAWLFLADTFDPGWSATVDGQARPIRLANAMFRAVAVPAGRHVVAFRYTPAPLAWGATVTLATGVIVLLVAGAGLAGAVRAGRPRRTDPPGAPSDRP
ncbi:MAG TPA: YfhO family protein, partial [Chloroflexota bacterium]|nr:YfhO family protein [Chloroflexota bacterium]